MASSSEHGEGAKGVRGEREPGRGIPYRVTGFEPVRFPLFDAGRLGDLQSTLGLAGADRFDSARMVAALVLVSWLPLVVLACAQGFGLGPTPSQSLLLDIGVYSRCLLALPLLLLAPVAGRERLQTIVNHFLAAELVRSSDREGLIASIRSVVAKRDSSWMEVLLIALAYAYTGSLLFLVVPEMPASWRTIDEAGGRRLSMAGWWALAVSQPIFAYLILRFTYRVVLWWRFLWQISRLDLHLSAANPDGAGGVAFLGQTLSTFTLPVLAITLSVAGNLADLVLWGGASFADYKLAVVAFGGFIVALFAGPLLFFSPALAETKRAGALQYSWLLHRHLREFEARWFSESTEDDRLLTDAPSVVADLGSVMAGVNEMRLVPFRLHEIIPLTAAAFVPFVPVVALEIPLSEITVAFLKLVV